jgi:hypothetical protein
MRPRSNYHDSSIVSNSKCVLLLFLAFCVIHTHRHPASARYAPFGDYGLVTVGPLSPLSSHPSPFHWTTSPSRGPSLATVDADKNLDDVVRIPARWDAIALEQFHPGAHHIDALLLLYN